MEGYPNLYFRKRILSTTALADDHSTQTFQMGISNTLLWDSTTFWKDLLIGNQMTHVRVWIMPF